MRKTLLFLLLCVCVFASENLLKNGHAGAGGFPFPGIGFFDDADGKVFSVAPSNKVLVSDDFIPVDADGRYELALDLRCGSGKPGKLSFGLMPFDEKQLLIAFSTLACAEDGYAVLAEDAKAGDTILKFSGAKNWDMLSKRYFRIIAMNAKEDYSDLPNRELCYYVTKIIQEGENISVELNRPMPKAYAAGTHCRLHRDGGYQWSVMENETPEANWKRHSAIISGMSGRGNPLNQFWKNCKFVKVVLFYHDGEAPLLIDKLSFARMDEIPENMGVSVRKFVAEPGHTMLVTSNEIWPRAAYTQDNDLIVINAARPWEVREAQADKSCLGYDGCAFIRNVSRAVYKFRADKAGKYDVYYRQRLTVSGNWNHTETLDGVSKRVIDCEPGDEAFVGKFAWHKTGTAELAEGEHTLEINFLGGAMLEQIAFVPSGQEIPENSLNATIMPDAEAQEALLGGFAIGPQIRHAVLSYEGMQGVQLSMSLDGGKTWKTIEDGYQIPDAEKATPVLLKASDLGNGEFHRHIGKLQVQCWVSAELPAEKSHLDASMLAKCSGGELLPDAWQGARWRDGNLVFASPLIQNGDGAIFARITDADGTVLSPANRSWFEFDDAIGAQVLYQGRLNRNLISYDFRLDKAGKFRPYFLMRMTESSSIVMSFNRPEIVGLKFGYAIDGKNSEISSIGKGLKFPYGPYGGKKYYWWGGNSVELPSGIHSLRINWGMYYMNLAAVAMIPEGDEPVVPKVELPATSPRQNMGDAVVRYAALHGRLQELQYERNCQARFEISYDEGKTFGELPALPMDKTADFILRAHFSGSGKIPSVKAVLAPVDCINLTDGKQSLYFESATGNLAGYELTGGRKLLPAGISQPLFAFEAGDAKTGFRTVKPVLGSLLERKSFRDGSRQTLELKYGTEVDGVTADVKVTVGNGLPEWELTLHNGSRMDVRNIAFPIFPSVRPGDDPERVFATAIRNLGGFGYPGAAFGGINLGGGFWPGSYSMGYSELYSEGFGSFSLQNRNPDGIGVQFVQKPEDGGNLFRISTCRRSLIEPGKSETVRYAGGHYPGDEHDICGLYGKWAHTWMDFSYVNGPLVKNVTAINERSNFPLDRTANQMIPISRWMGFDLHWHIDATIGFTHLFAPNYGNAEDIRRQGRLLEAAGQPLVHYWDHYGWSLKWENDGPINGYPRNKIPDIETLPEKGTAEKGAFRGEAGNMKVWGYDQPDCIMCTADRLWQEHAKFVMTSHFFDKYGMSGIYSDEACVYTECFNQTHSHGKQHGLKMVGLCEIYRHAFEHAKAEGRSFVLMGEGSPDYLLQYEDFGLRSGHDALDGAPLLFAFPEVKFMRGQANHPTDGIPVWEEALRDYHLHARSDMPDYAGNARHFAMHRRRIQDWMYNGVFRDDVGLSCGKPGIIARNFVRDDNEHKGLLVNVRNERGLSGTTLVFDKSRLPSWGTPHALALCYLMEEERVEVAQVKDDGASFSVVVPQGRASSILIPFVMPENELLRVDMIWPLDKGRDAFRISVMNFGKSAVTLPLTLELPDGVAVENFPREVSVDAGKLLSMDVPFSGRNSLSGMATATLHAGAVSREVLIAPNISNGSFEMHPADGVSADFWGTNSHYFVHAFKQMPEVAPDKKSIGGVIDSENPFDGAYSLKLPGCSEPLPFPQTLAGPYGRFGYPKNKAMLPWFFNSQQGAIVKPGTSYRLTFACRFAEDDGLLRVQAYPYTERQGQQSFMFKTSEIKPEAGDRTWKTHSIEFKTADRIFNATQTPVVFVNLAKSPLWIDAVTLEEIQ